MMNEQKIVEGKMIQLTAQDILVFIVNHANATEEKPIAIGNVEFWMDGKNLCYSLPTNRWDRSAVQIDINKLSTPIMAEMVSYFSR